MTAVDAPRVRSRAARAWRWALRLLLLVVTVVLTVVVGAAFDARRRHPELSPWHRLVPAAEMTVADLGPRAAMDEYLRREAAVFEQVHREIELALPDPDLPANRYNLQSVSSPSRLPRDYNRTFEVTPASPRGSVLLLHGLTDAPYSMRAIAERLGAAGYRALAIRLPGHGGVPGALTRATWQDWMAAARLGARHVAGGAPGRPFAIVGYSNGGALAVKYALDAIRSGQGPRPSRIVLLSPMIGVSPAARLSNLLGLLSPIPYFDRAAWLDVLPEYNPYKFNSFPTNAAQQTWDLSSALATEIAEARANGEIGQMPLVLTFQSLVDATVSTEAVVNTLYAALPANGSELVIFDINRSAGLDAFVRTSDRQLLDALFDRRASRGYAVTIVSNVSRDTTEVAAWHVPAGQTASHATPLGLSWPTDVFSLSHVALPFAQDDPVYGTMRRIGPGASIALGALSPRGERAILTVPMDTLMRATWNPFFPWLATRTVEWIDAPPPPGHATAP